MYILNDLVLFYALAKLPIPDLHDKIVMARRDAIRVTLSDKSYHDNIMYLPTYNNRMDSQ